MLEAAEAELIQLYQTAIADSLAGDDAKSERALRSLLENDLVVSGATEQLQQLRVLSMKNLAIAVSKQETRGREALGLFEAAIEGSPGDVGLIDRFGTLAARLGEWSAAKDAFVRGLELDPSHCTMRLKLLELLKHLDGQAPAPGAASHPDPSRVLLPNLPAVSRMSIPTTFGMDVPRKIVLDVADWIGLLRHAGRLRQAYRLGCPLIEIKVAMSDNEIEIDLDLEEDEGNEANDRNEGGGASEKHGGQQGSDRWSEGVNVGGNGVETAMNVVCEPFLVYPRPMALLASSATPEESAPRESPSQGPRRRRQETADGADGEPGLASTQQTRGMNMLDELGDFLDGPSSHFLHEADSLHEVDDGGGAWAAVLLPDEADAMLLSCNGIELPLDALCELLVVYFSQSQDLAKLKDADCRLLTELIETMDLPLPPSNLATAAEWVIERFSDLKERSLGKEFSNGAASEVDLRRLRALSERLLLRLAVEVSPRARGRVNENENNKSDGMSRSEAWAGRHGMGAKITFDGGASAQTIVAARYLFAKGKLMQALDRVEKAKECYAACLDIISVAGVRVCLDHLQDHSTITAPRVRSIMECVDFHSEMGKIRSQNQDKSGLQERLVSLSAKMLSGRETESLMLGVDPSGWKNILSALIDAAVKSNNTLTSLRCQIRLLHAMLPKGTSEEVSEAREDPTKFLDPVLKLSFMARLLNATQLDQVIYRIALEDVKLDEYEMSMLRDVLRRLLVTMHACHTFLCQATSTNGSQDRGLFKTCCVVLTYTSAFFLGLLRLGWSSTSAKRSNELVPVLERLFKELDSLNLLLVRRSMVPYFATPLLCQLQSKLDVKDPNSGMLEDQIVHMLKYAFDLSLAPEAAISSFAVSATGLKPRSITSEHEVRVIWPVCAEELASYSAKMLKDRAGAFVEECYAVAAACLPRDIKAPILAAVEKFGLQRPFKMGSSEFACPFMPISGLLCADGRGLEGGMLDKTDAPTGRSVLGPIVDQEICDTFASVFEAKIKLNPLDLGAVDRQTDVIGVDALQRKLDPYLWSLALNPDNTDHWFATGEFYLKLGEKVNELCFLEGRVPTDEESAEVLRRRNVAYWCLTIAGACANMEAAVLLEEDEGRRETLAGMFEYHGRALLSEGTEGTEGTGTGASGGCSRQALDEALSAFIAATRFSPGKYSNHMHLGVCSKLLDHPPREYLPALAHACELSQQDPRGTTFIDPLFELHAARMELLEKGEEGLDEETKALCSLYTFAGKGTAPRAETAKAEPGTTARSDVDVSLMYRDALDAMEWCLETNRSYYKPSLRLVASPRTSTLSRCEHLGLLFSNKTSRQFALGISRIQEKGAHLQKAQKAKRKRPICAADPSCPGILSQCQAEANVFNGVRYPVAACPAAMMPTSKNLGIGTDGIDTLRGHFLGTIRHALLEYVVVLRELGQVAKLEEIAAFLEKGETYCLRVPEFADITAYCRAGGMLLALQRANAAFAALRLSDVSPDTFLSGTFGNEDTLLCSSHDPQRDRGPEGSSSLEQAYNIYVDTLAYTSRERAARILHPVAKYMRWRLARGDLSDVDELCGKMLITNRGQGLLAKYACLYVCLMAKDLGESHGDDRNVRLTLTQKYEDFLQKVSGSNQTGMLGLVLLYHCHKICKKSDEMHGKCLSHAQECVQLLDKGCNDSTTDSTTDPLSSLRALVLQSILGDTGYQDVGNPEEEGGLLDEDGTEADADDADAADDDAADDDAADDDAADDDAADDDAADDDAADDDAADDDAADDDADDGEQDGDPHDDGRETMITEPGTGGVAAMALAAMFGEQS